MYITVREEQQTTVVNSSKLIRTSLLTAGRLVSVPVVLGLLILSGCSGETLRTEQLKESWELYSSDNLTYYYPPDSPRLGRMESFATSCEEIFEHVTRVLAVDIEERIEIFIFTTDQQSDSLLGQPAGFYQDGTIVLRIGQHPGGYLAQAVSDHIDQTAGSFEILEAGLFQLYAEPAVNAHARTLAYERTNRFIPLTDLADTAVVKDQKVFNLESASFCAFLLANFGPERFKMLWSSVRGFVESVERIYGVDILEFEAAWQAYYRQEAGRT